MLKQITDNIKLLEAPNRGAFPFCHCLLIEDDLKILVDTGFDWNQVELLQKMNIDVIINSHFHEDHRFNNHLLPNAKVWAHYLDAPAIISLDHYRDFYGFNIFNDDVTMEAFLYEFQLRESPVHHQLINNEVINSGKLSFKVIHTPGHTPGHICLHFQDLDILYTGDIDLSRFGPWYGHLCSDLDDFIDSINKCIELKPSLVVTGHKGIIKEKISNRFKSYLDTLYEREEKILKALFMPMNMEQLKNLAIFYGNEVDPYTEAMEKLSIYVHLKRLMKHKEVYCSEGIYHR